MESHSSLPSLIIVLGPQPVSDAAHGLQVFPVQLSLGRPSLHVQRTLSQVARAQCAGSILERLRVHLLAAADRRAAKMQAGPKPTCGRHLALCCSKVTVWERSGLCRTSRAGVL